MRSTEQSSHRLGREACSTGVRRSPAIDASKRVRTIACSGLVVPTVQTGGCVLELFFCLWLPAGLTSEVMIPVSVVSGRADGGGGLLLHSAFSISNFHIKDVGIKSYYMKYISCRQAGSRCPDKVCARWQLRIKVSR